MSFVGCPKGLAHGTAHGPAILGGQHVAVIAVGDDRDFRVASQRLQRPGPSLDSAVQIEGIAVAHRDVQLAAEQRLQSRRFALALQSQIVRLPRSCNFWIDLATPLSPYRSTRILNCHQHRSSLNNLRNLAAFFSGE